jgi:hypothetical protein
MINVNKDPYFCTKCRLKKAPEDFRLTRRVPSKPTRYCRVCSIVINATNYKKHKAAHQAYFKEYNRVNKIDLAAYMKEYFITHKKRNNAYMRKRYADNPERCARDQHKSHAKASQTLSDAYIRSQYAKQFKISAKAVTSDNIIQKRAVIQKHRLLKATQQCTITPVN